MAKKAKPKLNLTKKGFIAWLESKSPRAIVGSPQNGCACPISNFICTTSGVKRGSAIVDEGTIVFSDKSSKTPKWASDFIEAIDALDKKRISAKAALEVLQGA